MIVPGSANALMLGQSQGYNLTKSLRIRGASASAELTRTPASAGNRQKWTYSVWLKKPDVTPPAGGLNLLECNAAGNDNQWFGLRIHWSTYINQVGYTLWNSQAYAAPLLRDPAAWYHIVCAVDTTQATAANRLIIYINNVSYPIGSGITQNMNLGINQAALHEIGRNDDSYMTEVNFIDGQQLTPSSFGSTNADTGVWQPAKYTGTYGTNGFYLPFTDVATTSGSNAGLGKDFSGNGNYWTTNNISVTVGSTYDSMNDVPTLTSATTANYAVLNPIDGINSSYGTTSAGNLKIASNSANNYSKTATISMSSGKWYWEVTNTVAGSAARVGIAQLGWVPSGGNALGDDSLSYGYNQNNGLIYNNGTGTGSNATYTTGSVIGVAYDANTGSLSFYKNGSLQPSSVSSLTGTWIPVINTYGGSGVMDINFGQQPFSYTPPTGYVALNTYNLPTSTIVQGNKYMDATLYTGTGSSQSITNTASFKPDLVWTKARSSAYTNNLIDSVRGASISLVSNSTAAEDNGGGTYFVTAFNSNGFTVGIGTGSNNSGTTYVGWQWQAGQGITSSNTNGSITSTVSVNASAGFSVVTYTGTASAATVGHGLGVAPSMIVAKSRSSAGTNWNVYHVSTGNTKACFLNAIDATYTSSNYWNNTSPTSTVFSLGSGSDANISSATNVAYCWAEIAGFSKFGSYTANNSADGPFVYTGFRPRFILFKCTTVSADWEIYDSARDTYNVETQELRPNTSQAEATNSNAVDFLSNGFKLRKAAGDPNYSTNTYIYAAFAENPFKNALAR